MKSEKLFCDSDTRGGMIIMRFFFEGKQELYLVLCLLLNPAAVSIVFILNQRWRLWVAPLLVFGVSLAISAIFYPYYFMDIFTDSYDGTTIYWLVLFLPVQIISALLFTGLTYVLRKRNQRKSI